MESQFNATEDLQKMILADLASNVVSLPESIRDLVRQQEYSCVQPEFIGYVAVLRPFILKSKNYHFRRRKSPAATLHNLT